MEPIATPSENTVFLSKVVIPIRLSELVRTPCPTCGDSPDKDPFFSFSNSGTVPRTPPAKTTPLQVKLPFFLLLFSFQKHSAY